MFVAGKYLLTPVARPDGSDIEIAVDEYGNVKTAGAGTAGSPSGGVQSVQGVTGGTPQPVTISAPVGGGITWGAPTAVASDGASKTLVAANAARKAIRIWNPVGNAQMSYDLSGGVVTLALGAPLLSGGKDWFTGADCPVGIITFIGTNLQNLVYQEGT